MAKTGARTKGCFKNLNTGETLTFMFNPNAIKTSRKTNFNTYGGCGIPYPRHQYVGGEVETISFSLYLYDSATSTIHKNITFMEGLMPSKNPSDGFKLPPVVYFAFGSSFTEKCVVTGLSKTHTNFDSALGTTEITFDIELEVVK